MERCILTRLSKLAVFAPLVFVGGSLLSCLPPGDEPGHIEESNGMSQIVGGTDADPTPFFAMILRRSADGSYNSRGCGASLISSCHALTAAHCVDGSSADDADAVYINAYEPYDGNSKVPFLFTKVDKVIAHEGFVDSNNEHDVALLKLERCVTDERFEAVKLASFEHDLEGGQMLEVYGFGKRAEDDSTVVKTLQEVTVPFIEHHKCKKRYPFLADDSLCAGYDEGGKDACQGDSGGPIVDNSGEVPVQVGVVSWGVGCARARSPGVYASVSANHDWITEQVCSDDRESRSELCAPYGDNQAPVAEANAVITTVCEGQHIGLKGSSSPRTLVRGKNNKKRIKIRNMVPQ